MGGGPAVPSRRHCHRGRGCSVLNPVQAVASVGAVRGPVRPVDGAGRGAVAAALAGLAHEPAPTLLPLVGGHAAGHPAVRPRRHARVLVLGHPLVALGTDKNVPEVFTYTG